MYSTEAFSLLMQQDWPLAVQKVEEPPSEAFEKAHFCYPQPRLVFTLSGKARYYVRRCAQRQIIELTPGSAVLISAGALFRSLNEQPYETCGVLLRQQRLDVFTNDQLHRHKHKSMDTLHHGSSDLVEIFKRLEISDRPRQRRLIAMLAVEEVVELLQKSTRASGSYGHFVQLRSYLEKHFHLKVKRSQLAAGFHLNEDYVNQLFHRFADCSYSDYLDALRLEQACHLLQESELSIAEIAPICGYYHASYLSRRFKAVYRQTPLQFRKAAQQ